jgi:hypothetical protein
MFDLTPKDLEKMRNAALNKEAERGETKPTPYTDDTIDDIDHPYPYPEGHDKEDDSDLLGK